MYVCMSSEQDMVPPIFISRHTHIHKTLDFYIFLVRSEVCSWNFVTCWLKLITSLYLPWRIYYQQTCKDFRQTDSEFQLTDSKIQQTCNEFQLTADRTAKCVNSKGRPQEIGSGWYIPQCQRITWYRKIIDQIQNYWVIVQKVSWTDYLW